MTSRSLVPLRLGLAVVAAVALLLPAPARAVPHDAKITGVFRLEQCGGGACDPGSDQALKQGALVTGGVQVQVSAQANLGLEWVRLEAREPGDPRWYCLEFWNAGRAQSFSERRDWHTRNWTDPSMQCAPEACSSCAENSPHKHGALTRNLRYELRLVAREQGANVSGSSDDVSPTFELLLQIPPSAPQWIGEPEVTGDDEGEPVVTLQWAPNPEDDILEYRFVRVDDAGAQAAFAVSATRPQDQGCSQIAGIRYRCIDSSFPPSGFSGSYRYAIAALRKGLKGPACELSSSVCVVGALSSARTVALSEPGGPAPSNGTVASGTPTGTATGGGPRDDGPAPVAVSPLPNVGDLNDPAPGVSAGRAPWVAIAAVVLAIAAGTAAWRGPDLLRRRDRGA